MATSTNTNKKATTVKILKTALVAFKTPKSAGADISFTFSAGIGQATASLFRNGILINMQSISQSGTILFSDTNKGDVISINGICTGTCTIRINKSTKPGTPEKFPSGFIITGYLFN